MSFLPPPSSAPYLDIRVHRQSNRTGVRSLYYSARLLDWLSRRDSRAFVKLSVTIVVIVADSVNRGISTTGRMHAACTIGLSINEDLKLKKRKGRDRQQREKLYTIPRSREGHVSSAFTITSTITAVFCQCRNSNKCWINFNLIIICFLA